MLDRQTVGIFASESDYEVRNIDLLKISTYHLQTVKMLIERILRISKKLEKSFINYPLHILILTYKHGYFPWNFAEFTDNHNDEYLHMRQTNGFTLCEHVRWMGALIELHT